MLWLMMLLWCAAPEPAAAPREVAPLGVRCRYDCVCHRNNHARCYRHYTETCDGKACWQCEARLTRRARQSCAIGRPVKVCFCPFKTLRKRAAEPLPWRRSP